MPSKLDNLIGTMKDKAENLVTLEIVTAVGEVAIITSSHEGKNQFDVKIPTKKEAKAMFSQIDLLQGDIKTLFHEDFMTKDYQELREFHRSREAQGHAIITQNISMLKQLLEYVSKLNKDK